MHICPRYDQFSEKETEEETDRRRSGEAILKTGQEWILPAQLGQLKTGQDGEGMLRIHLWCPKNLPRLWDRIENRMAVELAHNGKIVPKFDFFNRQNNRYSHGIFRKSPNALEISIYLNKVHSLIVKYIEVHK